MRKILKGISLALLATSLLLTGCGSDKKAEPKADGKTKVAFVLIGSANDGGWSETHERARKYLQEKLPNVETTVVDKVSDTDSERVISQLASQGNKLIFSTSFGFMDPTLNVAKKNPNTTFMHATGFKTDKNMGTYFGRIYEARYLTGIVAGKETKSDIIGYVAAFPIPEVIRGINAFTIGVQSVNPNAKVKVIWTNTWYDPVKEKQAALSLIDSGADVIAQHQDTPGPQQAAEERGKYSIGYNMDMSKAAPKAVLTSAVWNWGPYYVKTVEAVQNGSWTNAQYWGGMKDGIVDIAPYGPMVQEATKQAVEPVKSQMKDGKFVVFKGPIKDQSGNVKVPQGSNMTDQEMLSFNWFVQGVDGSIPSK